MSRRTRPRSPDRSDPNALSTAARWLAATALVPLALTGCAQDAWRPNPNFSAFLNKVEQNCGTARIGELTVSQLMGQSAQSSAYFLDLTSRFDLGRISEEEYVLGVSSTFNTTRNSAGIRCILDQKTQ